MNESDVEWCSGRVVTTQDEQKADRLFLRAEWRANGKPLDCSSPKKARKTTPKPPTLTDPERRVMMKLLHRRDSTFQAFVMAAWAAVKSTSTLKRAHVELFAVATLLNVRPDELPGFARRVARAYNSPDKLRSFLNRSFGFSAAIVTRWAATDSVKMASDYTLTKNEGGIRVVIARDGLPWFERVLRNEIDETSIAAEMADLGGLFETFKTFLPINALRHARTELAKIEDGLEALNQPRRAHNVLVAVEEVSAVFSHLSSPGVEKPPKVVVPPVAHLESTSGIIEVLEKHGLDAEAPFSQANLKHRELLVWIATQTGKNPLAVQTVIEEADLFDWSVSRAVSEMLAA